MEMESPKDVIFTSHIFPFSFSRNSSPENIIKKIPNLIKKPNVPFTLKEI